MQFVDLSERLDEWNQFVDQAPDASFTQSSQQFKLLAARGKRPLLYGLVDDQNQILIGGIMRHEHVKMGGKLNLEYGPVVKDWADHQLITAYFKALRAYAKQEHYLFISVSPNVVYQRFTDNGEPLDAANNEFISQMENLGYQHEPFVNGMTDTAAVRWQYVKDLADQDMASIRKSYHKMVRQAIKKQKMGVRVRELQRDELPILKQIIDDTSARLHIHSKDLDYYEKTYDLFQDRVKFVIAELDIKVYLQNLESKLAKAESDISKLNEKKAAGGNQGRINRQLSDLEKQVQNHQKKIKQITAIQANLHQDVLVLAGAQFMIMPQEVDYLFSGSYEEYGEFYGPHQIQDYMLELTHDKGIKRYNFLGIDGKFDGSDGVMNFKTKFNGYVEHKVGTFDLPIQPVKYKIYQLAKRLLGHGA
ncbi:peptidoglycan bridge formation glycyltransferase FemA/FemB family protein [Weissella halotolerans]|uniref:FemAB family protein n=1 Tax=Weissella halotolerans DSM 20190 TaxID=1123500 RepID=A0A0R2G4S9_9LACO|nr:peptidoglycan bridge formation glycyltransferase FemA/FemB family protein [Weissella halotolerans]KRN32250.1 FemAB family protein [Weissella halotolerans DSM 20190]